MPEVRGGFKEFNAHLRLALHARADVDHFARLRFRIRSALQFQLLALRHLGRQCNQGTMRIDDQSLGFLCELPFRASAGNAYRNAQDHALAAASICVRSGG